MRRLDDGRRRLIRSATPCVYLNFRLGILTERKIEDLAQGVRVGANRRMNSVWVRFCECIIGFLGFGRDEDGDDGRAVAGLVKVFQVEAVVPGLIEVRALVTPLAYFEFDRENNSGRDQNSINTTSDPRNIKLKVNAAG